MERLLPTFDQVIGRCQFVVAMMTRHQIVDADRAILEMAHEDEHENEPIQLFEVSPDRLE